MNKKTALKSKKKNEKKNQEEKKNIKSKKRETNPLTKIKSKNKYQRR